MLFIPRATDVTIPDVQEVLGSCMVQDVPKYGISFLNSPGLYTRPWQGDGNIYYTMAQRKSHLVDLCQRLRKCLEKPDSHVSNIDLVLASLFECRISLEACQEYLADPELTQDTLVWRAYDSLKRLPPCPLELKDVPPNLPPHYFFPEDGMSVPTAPSWETLKVSNFLSTSIVQMVLSRVGALILHRPDACPNEYAQLLETASSLAGVETSESRQKEWFIVRAAVWSCWQRATMLCLYFDLRKSLDVGFLIDEVQPRLRETTPAPYLSVRKMSELYAAEGKADSMCMWAFGLLRRDEVSLCMDFRTFHKRYRQLWGKFASRCGSESGTSCQGKDPDRCRRYKGLIVDDQSMHDSSCPRATCTKLVWDEASYRAGRGARAVRVDEALRGAGGNLRYCAASESTLAISHVWSHSQGGQPHKGINSCLHQRYTQICHDLGCSEYWWDAACIPEDHTLRSEAIRSINSIFEKSKVTLVCDQDFMAIDISCITVQLLESILATALVCDWNMRAWTFLESFRGRHQIYLLCRDNKTINFRELCINVCYQGSIDIAIFALTLGHMLPQNIVIRGTDPNVRRDVPQLTAELQRNRRTPYLRKEYAGSLLSYRPATRPGDDVVIWSLLTGNIKFDHAEELLLYEPGSICQIYTGYLISTAPRSKRKTLSWLPVTPYFKSSPEISDSGDEPLRAFSGRDSDLGQITEKGLKAPWLVYEFDASDVAASDGDSSETRDELAIIARRMLKSDRWGALLRPVLGLREMAPDHPDPSAQYKGYVEGTVLAVVGSQSRIRPSQAPLDDGGWIWRGVYTWNRDVQLPNFREISDFLIE